MRWILWIRRQAHDQPEHLLEGVKSGPASPLTKQDWAELRADAAVPSSRVDKLPQAIEDLAEIAVHLAQ